MTDQVLDILKLVLLALLYLFFARVLWAVWSEVRQPANARSVAPKPSDATPYAGSPIPVAATPAPVDTGRIPKPTKGRGGNPGRLVVLEPKERKGTAFALNAIVGIGREADNTIVITDDSYVSAHHARLTPTGASVLLDDLGSKNGTYHNGAKITHQRTVHIGDRVQIGYTVLEAQ